MTCALGLPELASLNPFIKDLEETGYLVDFVGGYFVFYGIPYLDSEGQLQHGDLASPVDLRGAVIDPPSNHQMWWRGSWPCDRQRRRLRIGCVQARITITPELMTDSSFSYKLQDAAGVARVYTSFEEKVRTYLDTITAPALAVYPQATPLRGITAKAAAQGSPLRFPDTMSSRYHMNDISMRLRGKKVAIIGFGGTGSYILDFLARTVRPSISVCDAPCKSHYFISGGRVEWLPAFSEAMAVAVMRGQIARHAERDVRPTWVQRARSAIAKLFNRFKSMLRL